MNSRLIFNGRALARLMAATIGLALSVGAAPAQTAAQRDAIKSSCRSDYMANCMSVSPGGKEAFECLKNHYAALSAACKTAVDAMTPKPPPAAAAPPPPPAPKPALAAPKPPPAPPAPRPAAVAAPSAAASGRGRPECAAQALPLRLQAALRKRAAGRP